MEWLSDPQVWAALATLTALEIVLGIDNIIFISILAGRLPAHQREKARVIGLALAVIMRLMLLLSLVWVMGLNASLFTLLGNEISGRDLILLGGGLFLLVKSTLVIHESLEGAAETTKHRAVASFGGVLIQIAIIDIVFSLDSVITAVGLAQQVAVMAAAIVISVLVMMFAARAISDFVDAHPTIKMLALAFLILIGTALIAEGLDFHVPRGYIYFAMAFSVAVEMLNLRMRRRVPAITLRKPIRAKRRRA